MVHYDAPIILLTNLTIRIFLRINTVLSLLLELPESTHARVQMAHFSIRHLARLPALEVLFPPELVATVFQQDILLALPRSILLSNLQSTFHLHS